MRSKSQSCDLQIWLREFGQQRHLLLAKDFTTNQFWCRNNTVVYLTREIVLENMYAIVQTDSVFIGILADTTW